jgi:hypothetical protein
MYYILPYLQRQHPLIRPFRPPPPALPRSGPATVVTEGTYPADAAETSTGGHGEEGRRKGEEGRRKGEEGRRKGGEMCVLCMWNREYATRRGGKVWE